MGYKRMIYDDIYEIFRRWYAGHNIKQIAIAQNRSRKTIRRYLEALRKQGYSREQDLPGKDDMHEAINKILPAHKRSNPVTQELKKYIGEIKNLITDKREPVKPKTAYLIIKKKYDVEASYETFKIFCRNNAVTGKATRQMIRIELPPGLETQLDYGKVGYLQDRLQNKNRTVQAFCGLLSHSRLPFVQFVFSQNQQSFVQSHIDMFEFYGGATEFLSLDNLKSGVIKPDLYDPKLNKSYAEMADHYGVFLDPCRVATPTDKGKVERFVPVARELFRMLKNIYPTADIHELNQCALDWCVSEYGKREHGTTGVAPMDTFLQTEKSTLNKLPEERFEAPLWKSAKVHPDQFVTFERKRFSLPPKYRGETVWLRKSGHILRIFMNNRMLREYVVGKNRVNYLPGDFPEVIREMINGGYPAYLISQAKQYGNSAMLLINKILSPHAYINARRAQGFLTVMKKYYCKPFFADICMRAFKQGVRLPKTFTNMMQAEEKRFVVELEQEIKISGLGEQMARDINYYIN